MAGLSSKMFRTKRRSSTMPLWVYARREKLQRGAWPELTTATDQPADAASNGQLVTRLIRNWEIINASLDLPPYRPGRRAENIPTVEVSTWQAERFATIFAEELQ